MRKRTLIPIIVTVAALILTNHYWLIFRPMPVDFEIKGKCNCAVEVQLNKKDDNNFNRIKKQKIDINLDETNHAYFMINRARAPKRLRMIFTGLNAPVALSGMQFRNGKFKPALNKFVTADGRLKVENNTLIIYPEKANVQLDYTDSLDIRSAVKFDFKIFVIIAVLTYLFAFKISNYAAEFKSVKGKSRIEILFLTLFFVFLFVPMSYINRDEISEKENRTLAKWKPFISNNEINYNFGKDFNEWFNNRFNLRQIFIDNYTEFLICTCGKSNKGFMDKKSGFIYLYREVDHTHLGKITKSDYDALIEFNKFCLKHNIELYVLLVPDKGYVYPLTKELRLNDNYDKLIDKEINILNKNNSTHIINPLKAMQKEAQKNYLFFKTEHHWTDDGAFIGYKELMKEITKKHKDIKILKEEDFNIENNTMVRGDYDRTFRYGTTSNALNLSSCRRKKLHKTNYRYYTHKNSKLLEQDIKDEFLQKNKTYYYPKGADYRVIQLGTSQNENLTEFIPYTFKNVKRIRNNNVWGIPPGDDFKIMKYYEQEILDYKPNIIIFCITYNNMEALHNLFNME